LGLWRLDEKKGLAAVHWSDGEEKSPIDAEWKVGFAALNDFRNPSPGDAATTVLQYSFDRPDAKQLTPVWRVFMPDVPGLVYLNGQYMEHHEPGRTPNIGRDGIYLPPSMLKDKNRCFCCLRADSVAFAGPGDSGRAGQHPKKAELGLEFGSSSSQ
jgi:hypothetical protein